MNSLLNFVEQLQITSFLLGFILNMTIKGSIILCAAFAVNLILKRASAATRHFIWSTAFAGILLIPFLSFTLPSWNISLFESQQQAIESPQKGFSLSEFEQGLLFRNSQLEEDLEQSGSSIANNIGSTDSEPSWSKISEIIGSASSVLKKLLESFNWSWLIIIWTMGSLYILSLFMTRLIRSWLLVKHAEPLQNNTFNRLIANCFNRFGVSKTVNLLQSESITIPLMWGYFNPSIVLPKEAEKWPEKRIEIVLLHEAAHIKRSDFLSTLIAHTASVFYWYNPLIWIALRRFHFERENASDDYVLSSGTKPTVYARNLFEVAQALKSIKWASHLGLAIVRKNKLEGRVMEILNSTKQRSVLKPVTMLLVGLLAVSLLIPVSSIQTRAQKESTLVPSEANKKYQGMVLRQVWAGPEVDFVGSSSPDGRYLSFVDWDTGDLMVRDLSTGENRRLTNKGPWSQSSEMTLFSTWSPDGSKIAYMWYNKEEFWELRVINIEDSIYRVVYANRALRVEGPVKWSQDGKQILTIFSSYSGENRTWHIGLVSVEEGSLRILKSVEKLGPSQISLSPDGRFVAYDLRLKDDTSNSDIFVLSVNDKQETALVEHPSYDNLLGWTPDGERILFASNRTGKIDMWSIRIKEGHAEGTPELVKPGIGDIYPMGFTRSGSFFYSPRIVGDDVYVAEVDLETGKLLTPPVKVSQSYEGSNKSSEFSPDGHYLAYISQREPKTMVTEANTVCIHSFETGEQRDFALDIGIPNFYRVRWSDDSQFLYFSGRDKTGNSGLYQIDVETGEVTRIIENWSQGALVILSSDRKIRFYQSYQSGDPWTKSTILRHDIETGSETEIYSSTDSRPKSLTLSPDGSMLTFIITDRRYVDEKQTDRLMVLPTIGGEVRELLHEQAEGSCFWMLGWTSNGQDVLLTKLIPGNELWRIPIDGSTPQKLELSMEMMRMVSVHPDGRHIAFTSGKRGESEVWVIENLLPEIKK